MPNKGGKEVFFEKKNEAKSLSGQVTRVCSLATIFVATYHLTKLKKTRSIARKEGSGRPRSARTDANIEQVNELICSQDEDYLFMQDGARSHTSKLTLNHLGKCKHLKLLEPHQWPSNSPDLNPVDFSSWRMRETNVYRGRRITDMNTLKQAIVAKISHDVITKSIDTLRERLKRVVEVQGRHIEKYL